MTTTPATPLFNWPFRTYNGQVVPAANQKKIPQFKPEHESEPEPAPY